MLLVILFYRSERQHVLSMTNAEVVKMSNAAERICPQAKVRIVAEQLKVEITAIDD